MTDDNMQGGPAYLQQPISEKTSKPAGYWTLERCVESAAPFRTVGAWQAKSKGAYTAAHKNGWLPMCCAHMESVQKPGGYWTLERCVEAAAPFQSIKEWRKKASAAYNSAYKNGWLPKCTSHGARQVT